MPKLEGYFSPHVLAACSDPRKIWDDAENYYLEPETIQEIAWKLLTNQFTFDIEAYPVMLEALEHDNAIICAAAALLLQHSKVLPLNVRKEVIKKIKYILTDDKLSYRPLEPPTRNESWRLHNVLFETLKTIEEIIN